MFRTRVIALLGAMVCVFSLACPALAAEVDSGEVYCFSPEDFSSEDSLAGIYLTEVPEELYLGDRLLRAGDVLTREQAARMTFCPGLSETDSSAQVGYLPIFDGSVEGPAAMTIGIRGREDKPPVAEDSAAETYKNLQATGKLKATDPEGQALTFTVTRQPRRGSVTIAPDGSFTYTPRKNKVGIDSFAYTAADTAGKTSREATVTITILKPTDAAQYTDTAGREGRFAAEWMRHTGIFIGEQVAGNPCFAPDAPVTRGEFVTMLVRTLEIPTDEDLVYTGYSDPIPGWLQPYLAAAMRSGLTAGLDAETFAPEAPITGAEAALMLENALDTQVLSLEEEEILTRDRAALMLYEAKQLANQEGM